MSQLNRVRVWELLPCVVSVCGECVCVCGEGVW